MSKPIVFQFALRDPNYLSDKYIKEIQKEIPFDMELVSSIPNKKVDVHRLVVMMFSKQIRNLLKDSGNSFKNGHVILPVNVPYIILLKVIELFYDCQTVIPVNFVSDMRKALHVLQVDNVMDNVGSMPPPINVPYPGTRMSVNAAAPFNRRQTMVQMQPINDPKRRRSNIVTLPVPVLRPAPFEQARVIKQARPQNVSKSGPVPVPAVRNMGLMAITHGENSLASSPGSEHGQNKLSDESNKFMAVKMELPKECDTNKENERPELNLDVDISNDESFKDLMSGLEADIELNY